MRGGATILGNERYPVDSGWKQIPLTSPWGAYAAAWPTGQYRMTPGGVVMLRGLVANTANSTQLVVGYLPSGYWPGLPHLFTTRTQTNASSSLEQSCRVDVGSVGAIVLVSAGLNLGTAVTWLSLNGISFVMP